MHIMIIGGGQVGSYLAGLLQEAGNRVTVVETRETQITAVQRTAPNTFFFLGDGTDPGVLEAAGIRTAAVVAAVTGADETNLVITSLARFAFDVQRVVARVNNPHNTWMFTPAMGVDVALNQADVMAQLIARAVG
ncbi:MAG: NAD-binding protein [Chloroflexales bacterium]